MSSSASSPFYFAPDVGEQQALTATTKLAAQREAAERFSGVPGLIVDASEFPRCEWCSGGPQFSADKIASNDHFNEIWRDVDQLTPNDAIRLAQRLLVSVDAYGIQANAELANAKVVERYVRKAIAQLRGLSLS